MQSIVKNEDQTPEFSGFNTRTSREKNVIPSSKSNVNYLPLLHAKPSDPSTIFTSMLRAKRLANAKGQHWVVYTADQQLYKVACQITWADPEQFSPFILRLGGMHFLMSFIGSVGSLAADSGLAEVLESSFSGVAKMLSGKKFPQNFRALRMLTEELLRDILNRDDIDSMSALETHLVELSEQSRTSKLWIENIIRPTMIMMKFVRAEREGDFPLHLKSVEDAIPYFFSAGHINYARYGVHYLRQMKHLPGEIRERFDKGEHTIHLKAGTWNGIWWVDTYTTYSYKHNSPVWMISVIPN